MQHPNEVGHSIITILQISKLRMKIKVSGCRTRVYSRLSDLRPYALNSLLRNMIQSNFSGLKLLAEHEMKSNRKIWEVLFLEAKGIKTE